MRRNSTICGRAISVPQAKAAASRASVPQGSEPAAGRSRQHQDHGGAGQQQARAGPSADRRPGSAASRARAMTGAIQPRRRPGTRSRQAATRAGARVTPAIRL